jgi:anaerobic ribonucleoside-triphosphate reductase
MSLIPCAHLLTHPQPGCELELGYPHHCPACTSYLPGINAEERTRCEVWTRVMGYHRPVGAFNPGKQSEHAERQLFREEPHP